MKSPPASSSDLYTLRKRDKVITMTIKRDERPWGYYDRSVLAVAIEALKVHEGRLAALQADFEAYKSSHP